MANEPGSATILAMPDQALRAPVLDEANAAFIQRFVSINVAAANELRQPAIARAYGCRVSNDLARVTLFLYRDRSRQLLRDIRDSGTLAVVFSRPSTLETLQLKGRDATSVEVTAADLVAVDGYRDSFMRELLLLGYSEAFAGAMMARHNDELVGICFTPDAAFVATPGSRAGQPLSP